MKALEQSGFTQKPHQTARTAMFCNTDVSDPKFYDGVSFHAYPYGPGLEPPHMGLHCASPSTRPCERSLTSEPTRRARLRRYLF